MLRIASRSGGIRGYHGFNAAVAAPRFGKIEASERHDTNLDAPVQGVPDEVGDVLGDPEPDEPV